jgi:hypothetical protein
MAKDILTNVHNGNILIGDSRGVATTVYTAVWGDLLGEKDGKLYLNIIISRRQVGMTVGNGDTIPINAPYCPSDSVFYVRIIVRAEDGTYSKTDILPIKRPVYVPSDVSKSGTTINACELLRIDRDGQYLISVTIDSNPELSFATLYSGKQSDLLVGDSDDQSAQLLSLCAPGKYYRYPLTGIGVHDYISSVVTHTNLADKVVDQFNNDGRAVSDAEYDTKTGELDIYATAGEVQEDEETLTAVADLDEEPLKLQSDYYIAEIMSAYTDVSIDNSDFVNSLYLFDSFFGLYLFTENAEYKRISDTVQQGYVIGEDGTVTAASNTDYAVASEKLYAGDIIAFRLDAYNYATNPVFILKDSDSTVYVSPISDTDLSDEDYMKCAVILKECTISYGISYSAFTGNTDRGVFLVSQNDNNYNRMAAVTVDEKTGRVICSITQNSVVTDAVIQGEDNVLHMNINL